MKTTNDSPSIVLRTINYLLESRMAPNSNELSESQSFTDIAQSLHELPAFLPPNELRKSIILTAIMLCIIFAIHMSLLRMFKRYREEHGKPSGKIETIDWKKSFRLMNTFVNIFFATIGIYHYRRLPSETTLVGRLSGFQDIMILGSGQVAYQIYSLCIAKKVEEEKAMLFHHINVIGVGFLSAFMRVGFRYHNPFFYGVVESSTIPLTIMTIFRDDPSLIKERPQTYLTIRIIFAFMFLFLRIYMWLPKMTDFLVDIGIYWWTCDCVTCYLFHGFMMLCGVGLTILQLLWGYKVSIGLVKQAKKAMGWAKKKDFKKE